MASSFGKRADVILQDKPSGSHQHVLDVVVPLDSFNVSVEALALTWLQLVADFHDFLVREVPLFSGVVLQKIQTSLQPLLNAHHAEK